MNPLIAEIKPAVPSTTISLPSQGKFYSEDMFEEGADPTQLEVHPISLLDDLNIRDPILLASGKAVIKMMEHICPSILQPELLAEVDLDAILIASRIISHGTKFPVRFKCSNPAMENNKPVCEFEHDMELDLQDFIMRYGPIDWLDDYTMELDVGQTINLKPLPYRVLIDVTKQTFMQMKDIDDMLRIFKQTNQSDEETELTAAEIMSNPMYLDKYTNSIDGASDIVYKTIIHSIHSVVSKSGVVYTDEDIISEWIDILPPATLKVIRDRINELSERLVEISRIDYACPNCEHQNQMNVQFSPDKLFLVESSELKPPMKSSPSSKKVERKGRPRLGTLPK